MIMHIGFTGTQHGMSAKQRAIVGAELAVRRMEHDDLTLHHGDCIGADADADRIAHTLGIEVELHPPDNPTKRAYCSGAIFTHRALPYLERNREIVRCADLLVATPRGSVEQRRSGTWATIRQAQRSGVPVLIVYPDGTTNLNRSSARTDARIVRSGRRSVWRQ